MGSAIVTAITSVFTDFIPSFGSAVVDMFEGIFYTVGTGGTATLTPLAEVFLVFIGIGLSIGLFRLVYKIFKSKLAKRV